MEPQASSCSLMLGSPMQEFWPLCGAVRRRARRLRHDDARLGVVWVDVRGATTTNVVEAV